MELQEFLEQYLPDYENKFDEIKSRKIYNGKFEKSNYRIVKRKDKDTKSLMVQKYFSEALQNFTDKICEEQRNNCLGGLDDSVSDRIWDEVKNAKQPEIE